MNVTRAVEQWWWASAQVKSINKKGLKVVYPISSVSASGMRYHGRGSALSRAEARERGLALTKIAETPAPISSSAQL